MSTHVIIIGAGLSGSLMGCYLARAGYRVSIYERRPDPRKKGYLGGRSINLALSIRGLARSDRLGVEPEGRATFAALSRWPSRGIQIGKLHAYRRRLSDHL